MDKYDIISLRSQPRWRMPAARWFAARWGIPLEEYLASIDECIRGAAPVPQWYIVTGVEPGRIVAETGVITNDFHDRKDLAPNVCALYVEPELRRCGIAGLLLEHICEGMAARGVGTLYLITEHTSFYERYGWGAPVHGMGRAPFVQNVTMNAAPAASVFIRCRLPRLGSGVRS